MVFVGNAIPNFEDVAESRIRPGSGEIREDPVLSGKRAIDDIDSAGARWRIEIGIHESGQMTSKAEEIRSGKHCVVPDLPLNHYVTLMNHRVLKTVPVVIDRRCSGRSAGKNIGEDRSSWVPQRYARCCGANWVVGIAGSESVHSRTNGSHRNDCLAS